MSGPSGPTCRHCGKVVYGSRKLAKRMARRLHPGQAMNEYRCGDGWHIGHLPEFVKAGVVSRARYEKSWT